jgi:uncharacterized protein YndB with AHSA1/START domain
MSMIEEPIFQKTFIRADIEKVFRGIATAEGLDEWFTEGTILDEKAGGRIEFVWKDWGPDKVNLRSGGPILEYSPPRRFVYKWGREPQSTVEIDLEEFEGSTLITARETGYFNDKDGWARCLDCASGWGEALTLLKFYLEHGLTY